MPASPTRIVLRGGGLFGRTAERARLVDVLSDGVPVVALVGPPGCGKSALAEAVAVDQAAMGRPPGGAIRVELAGARTVDALVARTAEALGIPLGGVLGAEGAERIAHALARTRPLLLVDGWEGVAPIADGLLALWTSTGAQILVTSQIAPRAPEVVVHALGPLTRAAAIELLHARAQAGRPVRPLTPEDQPALAVLAQRVDHLPLALELVAARLAVLTPGELLARLPATLAGGATDPLAQAITWAIGLLDAEERAALAVLCAYPAGTTIAIAEQLLPPGRRAALDRLQGLRERSLLHAWVPSPGAHARLAPYQAVRDALPLPSAPVRRADETFLAIAEGWASEAFARPDGGQALERLATERANLEALLARAEDDRAGGARAARALLALEPVLLTRAPPDLHASMCARVLARVARGPSPLRARVLLSTGGAERARGAPDAARQAYEAARAVAVQAGDRRGESVARAMLGCLDVERGDAAGATAHLEAADALARALPDRHAEGLAASYLAALHAIEGRAPEAIAAARRAVQRFDEVGELRLGLMARIQLGTQLFERGALDEARTVLEDAHARARALGDDRVAGKTAGELGLLDQEHGRLDAAQAWHALAVGLLSARGPRRWEAVARGYQAACSLEAGDHAVAARTAAIAISQLEPLGDVRNAGFFRAIEAAALAADGALAAAEDGFAAARGPLDAQGDSRRIHAAAALEALLDVERAARAPDPRTRTRELAAARARLAAAAPFARTSNDVRYALRIGRAALALDRALVVDEPGRTVRQAGVEVSFARHATLWRLVLVLVARRREAPGTVVAREELLEAGWPHEQILPRAAANRLHVALSTLRRIGLRDVIQHDEGGWRLRPDVTVRRVCAPHGLSPVKPPRRRVRGELASKEVRR